MAQKKIITEPNEWCYYKKLNFRYKTALPYAIIVEVVAVKKRKPTKKKTVPSKEGVGCLIHIDDNLMARMKIFQSYMKEENGITLKTAPTVKFLVNAGLTTNSPILE